MNTLVKVVLFVCLASFAYCDVGYVGKPEPFSLKSTYSNSWRVNVAMVGDPIIDFVVPYDMWITVIVLGGEQTGTPLLKIGNYEISRYPYAANVTVGEVFENSKYVAAGVHVKVILESGTPGYHTVSISGRF